MIILPLIIFRLLINGSSNEKYGTPHLFKLKFKMFQKF